MEISINELYKLKKTLDMFIYDSDVRIPTGLSLLFTRIYNEIKKEFDLANKIYQDSILDIKNKYITKNENGEFVFESKIGKTPQGINYNYEAYVFNSDDDRKIFEIEADNKFKAYSSTKIEVNVDKIPASSLVFDSMDKGYIPQFYFIDLSTILEY